VLDASVLLEAVATATSHHEKDKTTMPKGKGAKNQPAPAGLLRFFDTREYDDDVKDYPYGIPQILKLMNSNLTNSGNDVVNRLAKGSNKQKVIEDIYLTVLARRPSSAEVQRMTQFVAKQGDTKGYQGVFWALLNSAEFACNR
jgi:hypothetical protein